ncbi:unnamed protein product [Penicillium manginii]
MSRMGKISASSVAAASLQFSFPYIRVGLLVGICGGVPVSVSGKREIILGDVLISTHIVQIDLSRLYPHTLLRKNTLQDNIGWPSQEIVPFDRVVVEDVESRDIAPRNLLIDPGTNKILLFDFDWAAHGKNRLLEGRDDVTAVVFTLYELISNDAQFTSIPDWNRTLDMVQNISEWTCNRELDSDVSTFRNFLNDWVATRKSDGDLERYLNAPNRLTWPDLPVAPDYNVPFELGKTSDGEPIWTTGPRLRRIAMEKGQYCFRWERPPHSQLLNKARSGLQ